MSDTQVKTIRIGPGFCSLLGLVFITLKLTGVVVWSWWLVLLPIYGPLALILGILFAFLLVLALVAGGLWVYEKASA